jgi:hypothetical protein
MPFLSPHHHYFCELSHISSLPIPTTAYNINPSPPPPLPTTASTSAYTSDVTDAARRHLRFRDGMEVGKEFVVSIFCSLCKGYTPESIFLF